MSSQIDKHTVKLCADASISICINGLLEDDNSQQIIDRIDGFATQLSSQGFPVHVLLDLHFLDEYTEKAEAHILDWLLNGKFDKLAMVGTDLVEKLALAATAKMTGLPIEFFESTEMATKWLKE